MEKCAGLILKKYFDEDVQFAAAQSSLQYNHIKGITMKTRINFLEKTGALKAMYGFGAYLHKSSIEEPLLHLLSFRVSQINGCAYCLDMHSKDLRAAGETEQRLYTINTCRETPFFTERERA